MLLPEGGPTPRDIGRPGSGPVFDRGTNPIDIPSSGIVSSRMRGGEIPDRPRIVSTGMGRGNTTETIQTGGSTRRDLTESTSVPADQVKKRELNSPATAHVKGADNSDAKVTGLQPRVEPGDVSGVGEDASESPSAKFDRFAAVPDIETLAGYVDRAIVTARTADPEAGTIKFYEKVMDELPHRIPSQTTDVALRAISENWEDAVENGFTPKNVRGYEKGVHTLTMLNLRSVLRAAKTFREYDKGDADDMVQTALAKVTEKTDEMPGTSRYQRVSSSVHRAAANEIARYIAARDGVPVEWVISGKAPRVLRSIDTEIDSGSFTDKENPSSHTAGDLAREYEVALGEVNFVVAYRQMYGERDAQRTAAFPPVPDPNDPTAAELRELREARVQLADRSAAGARMERILDLRYGLTDDPHTLDKTAENVSLCTERTRVLQIDSETALRSILRDSS